MEKLITMSYDKAFLELFVIFIIVLWAVMQWQHKLPTMDSVKELSSVLNSRGGNIMVLGSMSLVFFFSALKFTYWTMTLAVDGKIDQTQTLATAAFTFMTGSAFGGAFTSMVKAMTGEDSQSRTSDNGGPGRVTITAPVTPGSVKVEAAASGQEPSKEAAAPQNGN